MGWVETIVVFLRALLRDHAALAAENLALRQQLAILEQRLKRPRLRKRDRIFWVWLSRMWGGWRSVLAIVQPETVLRWLCLPETLSGAGIAVSARIGFSGGTAIEPLFRVAQ